MITVTEEDVRNYLKENVGIDDDISIVNTNNHSAVSNGTNDSFRSAVNVSKIADRYESLAKIGNLSNKELEELENNPVYDFLNEMSERMSKVRVYVGERTMKDRDLTDYYQHKGYSCKNLKDYFAFNNWVDPLLSDVNTNRMGINDFREKYMHSLTDLSNPAFYESLEQFVQDAEEAMSDPSCKGFMVLDDRRVGKSNVKVVSIFADFINNAMLSDAPANKKMTYIPMSSIDINNFFKAQRSAMLEQESGIDSDYMNKILNSDAAMYPNALKGIVDGDASVPVSDSTGYEII